jgi:crossover junction endodeoxyribonuclease RuvC
MVRILLGQSIAAGADATDALAVAICHAHHHGTAQRLGAAAVAGA